MLKRRKKQNVHTFMHTVGLIVTKRADRDQRAAVQSVIGGCYVIYGSLFWQPTFPVRIEIRTAVFSSSFFFLNSSSSEIIHFQVTSAPLLFSHLHIALRFFFLSYFLPVSPQKGGQSSGRGSLGVKMALFCIITTYFFFQICRPLFSTCWRQSLKNQSTIISFQFFKRIFESF